MREHFLTILRHLKKYDGDMESYRIDDLLDMEDRKKLAIIYQMVDEKLIYYDNEKSQHTADDIDEIYAMIRDGGIKYLENNEAN